MKRLKLQIDISATKERIWHVLWNLDSYREWTRVFMEGSDVVTDNWKEGSKVLFLTPSKNGMYSEIERHVPNQLMSFKHIGNVIKGEEQPLDDETRKWSGAMEIYELVEGTNGCTLSASVDLDEKDMDSTRALFNQALEKVKELAEVQ